MWQVRSADRLSIPQNRNKDIDDCQPTDRTPECDLRSSLFAADERQNGNDQGDEQLDADLGHVDFIIDCTALNEADQQDSCYQLSQRTMQHGRVDTLVSASHLDQEATNNAG
jgi:hypothetical protein